MNTLYATNSHLPLFEVILPDPYPFSCNGDRSAGPVCCSVSKFEPRDGYSKESSDYPEYVNGLHERMYASEPGTYILPRQKGLASYRKLGNYDNKWENTHTGEFVCPEDIPLNNTYYVKGKGK